MSGQASQRQRRARYAFAFPCPFAGLVVIVEDDQLHRPGETRTEQRNGQPLKEFNLETEMLCLHLSTDLPCETALLLPLLSPLDSAVLTSTALRPSAPCFH
ncbi:hypothetical protein EYF80_027546 [Liparis tanakae]|uniref:Uncharacterized protein n=1 Tax=Liparis tanakae TaxID=230148 RepID=A0A4Z2HBX2_9TELE|nr:hypothetical protein EYF80_027546 [Liparis tanakae]